MNETSLTVTNGTGNALTQYGQRDEIGELVNRLMKLHPQAIEVGEQGMMIVAQTAILLGANPLPGANELHVWKDNKNKTCFQLGINFLRRKAMEWGGVLFQVRPRQMSDQERRDYGVAQGNLAAICIDVRVDDMEKWHGRGFGANEVWDMCGRVGIGTASPTEYPKNGRPLLWTVFLRAERDMMRQLFPHQMKSVEQSIPDGDGEPGQWDEQVFDAGQSDEPIIAGEFAEKSVDDLNDELFGVTTAANGKPAPVAAAGIGRDELNDTPHDNPVTVDADKITLFRGKVEKNPRATVGTVCSAVVPTGLYRSEHQALQAALEVSADFEKSTQLSQSEALSLFDRLVARKAQPIDEHGVPYTTDAEGSRHYRGESAKTALQNSLLELDTKHGYAE